MITKNKLIVLGIALCSTILLQAKTYVHAKITIGGNDRVEVELSTLGTIADIVSKDVGANQLKTTWFSDIRKAGIKFKYDSGAGVKYGNDIGHILNPTKKQEVINAQTVFENQDLLLIRQALYHKAYDVSADIELANNPYSAANRAIYNAVRRLGKTVGIELPSVDWPWSDPWKALAITTMLGIGVFGLYYWSPKTVACGVEGLGTLIKKTGEYTGSAAKISSNIVGTGLQKTGQYLQPKGTPAAPAPSPSAPVAPATTAPSTGGWFKSLWPSGGTPSETTPSASTEPLTVEQASHVYGLSTTSPDPAVEL